MSLSNPNATNTYSEPNYANGRDTRQPRTHHVETDRPCSNY
jgi:hypothetical protein